MLKRLSLLALAGLGLCFAIELAGQAIAPGKLGIVSPAEAIIGMPLTPVSVAGVARRTVRRCAVGIC